MLLDKHMRVELRHPAIVEAEADERIVARELEYDPVGVPVEGSDRGLQGAHQQCFQRFDQWVRVDELGNRVQHEGSGAMVTRRVIVCLDVKGGRVVKGVQFESLRDIGDPVALAAAASAAPAASASR
mgnify:CR=1 FL=1